MMVCKWCTAPKLTWSLAINITNDEKASGTLPLKNCGCLPRSPHPSDPPPDSYLSPPHPGWGKTHLSGEFFPQNPYCATYASALEYSNDGLMDDYTYPPPCPRERTRSWSPSFWFWQRAILWHYQFWAAQGLRLKGHLPIGHSCLRWWLWWLGVWWLI